MEADLDHAAPLATLEPAAGERHRRATLVWRAMGSTARVVALDPPNLLHQRCVDRIGGLERRWSRFNPDSEVSRLNRNPTPGMHVTPDTARLLTTMQRAWLRTAGRFDPTVFDAVVAAGYRTTIEDVRGRNIVRVGSAVGRPPGLSSLEVIDSRVSIAAGVRLDPGGIGKGLAADILTEELLDAGATGVLVSMGGDVRVEGDPSDERGWGVSLHDPAGNQCGLLALTGGAVATSTTRKRRWRTDRGDAHHLIDPRTGEPAETDIDQVSVLASRAWLAEALATAITVSGLQDAAALLADDAAAMILTRDGRTHLLGGMERWLR